MAIETFGISFEYANSGTSYSVSSGWTEVNAVTEAEFPGWEVADIKTTTHSTSDKVHTYISGTIEPGESSVTIQYSYTVLNTLNAMRGNAKRFRLSYSDGTAVGWAGYIKNIKTVVDGMDEIVAMEVHMKVSGDLVPVASIT